MFFDKLMRARMLLASLFQNRYAVKYPEYWAYWHPKYKADALALWAMFLFPISIIAFTATGSHAGSTYLGSTALNLLCGLVVVVMLAVTVSYDRLLYSVSGGHVFPGVLTLLTVLSGAGVFAFFLTYGSGDGVGLLRTAATVSVMPGIAAVLFFGEDKFKEIWQKKIETTPSKGYIDGDGVYRKHGLA